MDVPELYLAVFDPPLPPCNLLLGAPSTAMPSLSFSSAQLSMDGSPSSTSADMLW